MEKTDLSTLKSRKFYFVNFVSHFEPLQFIVLFIFVLGFGVSEKSLGESHGGFMKFYSRFAEQGVPAGALKRALEFMDLNYGKTVNLLGDGKYESKQIGNENYMVVIDFTQPSSQQRLYLLNFKEVKVIRSYVAHGAGSGDSKATRFSNKVDSKMSSLGFYLTGGIYTGKHGKSIYLYGVEKSNDRARQRMIVFHAADYVSQRYVKSYGRLGRSWGCPAVSIETMRTLLARASHSTVVYAHY